MSKYHSENNSKLNCVGTFGVCGQSGMLYLQHSLYMPFDFNVEHRNDDVAQQFPSLYGDHGPEENSAAKKHKKGKKR